MSDFLERISNLSPRRLALLAAQLQSRIEALEGEKSEPVAVIGMGCRFPGGAASPESFWDLLREGVDAIEETPESKWDNASLYDPDPQAPGKLATRWGGYLRDLDKFDPAFFGISPREAQSMDPQQRLLLEVTWEALEDAGQSPEALAGSPAGVFVGIAGSDFSQLMLASGQENIDAYLASGSAHSLASGRISYVLGIQGPSVSIDTACSSSLAAIHLAVQSLRSGECNLAIAGGVNVILAPETSITLSKAQMMAADGRCKTFDARADGFVRGEGCGIAILKPLSQALKDHDHVLAVIRGSAMNQDGRSNGLTAPNGPSQEAVIRAALKNAGAHPHEIGYVETHGTGTSLGDPIEVQALGAVLCKDRAEPLYLGSVKTNIGHLESAAGAAGLIKTVLALRHREIPPSLHLHEPNPLIPWDRYPQIDVPTRLTPWAVPNGRRLAAVSSFGFSGTNVHVVLEEAPEREPVAEGADRPLHIFTLSARDEVALKDLARRYERRLSEADEDLANVCFTANSGRAHHSRRLAVVTDTVEALRKKLGAFANGEPDEGDHLGQASGRAPRVAFLFTGQGSQYIHMGRELYRTQPTFRRAIERCSGLLEPYLERSLIDVLYPEDGSQPALLDRTEYTQPALFALEVALAGLWRSWGVRPSAVLGHSLGEYAAAYFAGVFSLEDGLRLAAGRGRLMGRLPGGGKMAAVFAGRDRVSAAVAPYAEVVSISAINGPRHCVISGDGAAVAEIVADLDAQGVKSRFLNVSHAFHSPLMDPILEDFERIAGEISYHAPQIDIYSNLSGEQAAAGEMVQAGYWRRQIRNPVRFAGAMEALYEQGFRHFLEIGPSPTLLSIGRQCISDEAAQWLPSLRKGISDWRQMLDCLGRLYTAGLNVDWSGFDEDYAGGGRRFRISLPVYPFQRESFWLPANAPARKSEQAFEHEDSAHPLLGARLQAAAIAETVYQAQIGPLRQPYLADHRIFGEYLLPSPVYLEISHAAAARYFGAPAFVIENLAIDEPLLLPETETAALQTVVAPLEEDRVSIRIFSLQAGGWRLHAGSQARLVEGVIPSTPDPGKLDDLRSQLQEEVPVGTYYEKLGALGLEFGARFKGVEAVYRAGGEALGIMQLPEALESEAHAFSGLHPALLDTCFHLVGAALPGAGKDVQAPYLLIGVERVRFYRPLPSRFLSHIRLSEGAGDLAAKEAFSAGVYLYAEDGSLLAEFEGLQMKRVVSNAFSSQRKDRLGDLVYAVRWEKDPKGEDPKGLIRPLGSELESKIERWRREYGIDRYDELMPKLDALCAAYMFRALRDIDPQGDPKGLLRPLGSVKGIDPRYRRLLQRMVDILVEEGILAKEGSSYAVLRPEGEDPRLLGASLMQQFPDFDAELTLANRCGENLAGVLLGRVDPLQLLFPGGSLADTEKLYGHSPSARFFNTLLRDALQEMVAHSGPERAARILEIGAGTGSATSYVLPVLPPDRTQYVFSDISPLFLNRAREKFESYPFIDYRALDIGRDPLEQGFEPHRFDVVIAANVLHATPYLRETLHNVKSLLAPGGVLILLEATRPQRFADLTVGLTEGWWAFSDADLRPSYALLSRSGWRDLLAAEGFSEVGIFPGETARGALSQQAMIVSRGPLSLVAEPNSRPGAWLILQDRAGVGERLGAALEARGQAVARVTAAKRFKADGKGNFSIDPARLAHYRLLLETLRSKDRLDLRGILHLWALDAPDQGGLSARDLERSLPATCGSLLRLVQALSEAEGSGAPRLWAVTRGAQPVEGSAPGGVGAQISLAQAPVWGLSHVISLEHPELGCVRIDLDPSIPAGDQVSELLEEIWRPDLQEDQIAFRDGARRVRRLFRANARIGNGSPPPATFRPDGSYLIAGGMGGLGLLTARWMAERGARNIVLLGRRGPSAQAQDAIDEIARAGVRVVAVKCDVSVKEDVERCLAEIENSLPPLRGVIHAAGVLDDGVLLHQDWKRFSRVMAPKVAGSWNLHTLTLDKPLDFTVFFSSGASLLGSPGQGNHAAANAFIDALAHYRAALGYPAVSINWGAWSEIGSATVRKLERQNEAEMISPEEGLKALEWALFKNPSSGSPMHVQFGVLGIDWPRFLQRYPPGKQPALLDAFINGRYRIETGSSSLPEDPGRDGGFLHEIGSLSSKQRLAFLNARVRELSRQVLGITSAKDVDPNQPLSELGLDSLMAVDLRNKLGALTGQVLPATMLFEYPTINAITNYLSQRLQLTESMPHPVEPFNDLQNRTGSPEAFDGLSDEELYTMLEEKIASVSRRGK